MTREASEFPPTADGRQQPRTHLFVAAVLCSGVGASPVHIRNMSPSGALVEASVLPAPGTIVTLKRGSLTARGRLAWKDSRKAGVAFDATVFVTDWMSRKPADHQHRIDELVSCLRVGSEPNGGIQQNESQHPLSVESELALLKADLTELGNSLAGDMIMVATHPEIQLIDISLQRIDRIMVLLANA